MTQLPVPTTVQVILFILKDILTVDASEHHVVDTRAAFFPNRSCHRFNCFQMRRQRYELILEHPNFQRRKMISRTDPVIFFFINLLVCVWQIQDYR